MMRFKWGLFIVVVFLAMSCQKLREDKLPPTIYLQGNNPDTLFAGLKYCDPGAEIIDDKPGTIDTVIGEIGADTGTYYLDYIAVDVDSNYAYKKRAVIVQYAEDYFSGKFKVMDTVKNVSPIVYTNYFADIDMVGSNIFQISNFNNFGNSFRLIFQPDSTGSFILEYISGDTIITGGGKPGCNGGRVRISYNLKIDSITYRHKTTYEK